MRQRFMPGVVHHRWSRHGGIKPKLAARRNILLQDLPRTFFQVLYLTVQKIYSKQHGLHM